jgi:hypothetical protein
MGSIFCRLAASADGWGISGKSKFFPKKNVIFFEKNVPKKG